MKAPTKVNSERLLAGPVWQKSFAAQSYINPRTNEIYEYGIFKVDCPPCVTVFPVTDDFNVITIKQYRHAADEFILELPGGIPPTPEMDIPTVIAELAEETGYAIAGEIRALTPWPIYFDPASLTMKFQPFLACGCFKTTGELKLDDAEQIEVANMPIDDWLHMIERGEVRDAKSIVTTFLAMTILRIKQWPIFLL